MMGALCVGVIARSFQKDAFVARAAPLVEFVWRAATIA